MQAGIVVLGVLSVAAVVWAWILQSRLRAERARSAALDVDVERLRGEVTSATGRAEAEGTRADAATLRADAAEKQSRAEAGRAREAEQRAKAEWDRASSAEGLAAAERTRAEAERDRAEAERLRAEAERTRAEGASVDAETAAARAVEAEHRLRAVRRTLDPEGLWLFERRRICRLWRDWVSVSLDGLCPVPDRPDGPAIQACVTIMAEASREECGVPIDVRWDLDGDAILTIEGALVTLRAAEELVATARRTNGGELRVHPADDDTSGDLVLSLATEPDQVIPDDLVANSSLVGWAVTVGDALLTIRLPGVLTEAVAGPDPEA